MTKKKSPRLTVKQRAAARAREQAKAMQWWRDQPEEWRQKLFEDWAKALDPTGEAAKLVEALSGPMFGGDPRARGTKLLDERDARNAEIITGLRKELQAQDFEIARLTSELRGAPVKEDQVPTWLYNQLLDRLLKVKEDGR